MKTPADSAPAAGHITCPQGQGKRRGYIGPQLEIDIAIGIGIGIDIDIAISVADDERLS